MIRTKILYRTILLFGIVSLISACEQNNEFVEPVASIKVTYVGDDNQTIELIDPFTVKVNTELSFTFLGSGDNVTYWLGDEKHNYAEYLDDVAAAKASQSEEYVKKSSRGLSGDNNGDLIYKFKTSGEYTIVVFVTSNRNLGEEFIQTSLEQKITVVE